jgi:DNA-binding GntR family transcriptional regulator
MSPSLSSSPSRPLRETVYTSLKRQILSGQLSPGTRLIESSLAAELKASRTVIREAVKQLELEGLVRITPYKGTEVVRFSLEDITEIYAIQAALEGMAASLAAQRMDRKELKELRRIQNHLCRSIHKDAAAWQRLNVRFHQFFLERSGNRRLQSLIKNHRDQFARYWRIILSIPGQRERNTQDHEKILQALEKRNPLKVRLAMEEHIQQAANNLTTFFKSIPF